MSVKSPVGTLWLVWVGLRNCSWGGTDKSTWVFHHWHRELEFLDWFSTMGLMGGSSLHTPSKLGRWGCNVSTLCIDWMMKFHLYYLWSFKGCKILKYGLPRKVHQVARSEQKKSTSSGQSFNLPQAGNGFWRMKGPVRREVRGGQRGEGRAILSQMRRLRWSRRRRRKRGRRRAWQSWAEESH